MEVAFVIGKDGKVIYVHMPPDRTAGSLPDSGELWEFIWENRNDIQGIAHSHPGGGTPCPSGTDVTTFSAIERALGRRLDWWITSSDTMIQTRWVGPGPYAYRDYGPSASEPKWAQALRALSE